MQLQIVMFYSQFFYLRQGHDVWASFGCQLDYMKTTRPNFSEPILGVLHGRME